MYPLPRRLLAGNKWQRRSLKRRKKILSSEFQEATLGTSSDLEKSLDKISQAYAFLQNVSKQIDKEHKKNYLDVLSMTKIVNNANTNIENNFPESQGSNLKAEQHPRSQRSIR